MGQKNWNHLRNSESLILSQFKLLPSLVYMLKFLSKTFQFYFFKLSHLRFGGVSYLSVLNYWSSALWTKQRLEALSAGSLLTQITYKNCKFSFKSDRSAILLSQNNNLSMIKLPSSKVILVESDLATAGIKTNFASNEKRRLQLFNKASYKFHINRKPFVKGKSMNVFDHPNGGFKRSSKILKTFKGKRILK